MNRDVIEAVAQALPEGAKVRELFVGLINIYTPGRDLARADVDAARAVLTEAGYVEVESWVALEGASWLSDGVASVSIKIENLEAR